jgi:hypothetical protein
MAKGKFKHKPTGQRTFSSPEEIGTYAKLRNATFAFPPFGLQFSSAALSTDGLG